MELKELQKSWHAWGKQDPLYAILTFPDKRNNKWEIDEFFRTGQLEIAEVLASLEQLGIQFGKKTALDFGCGAGRLTQALCDHFAEVTGIDIAPSMLELAKKYNRAGQRCHYVLNAGDSLSQFENDSFDFIYTCRVLQHMEPRFCRAYLREFVRVLSPDGLLVFQQPTEALPGIPAQIPAPLQSNLKIWVKSWLPESLYAAYWRTKEAWLNHQADRQLSMEMYYIPQAEMISFLEQIGAQLLDVREDDSVPGAISVRYCVVKRSVRQSLCN